MNKFRRFLAAETCLKIHYSDNKSQKSPRGVDDATRPACLRRIGASPSDHHLYLMTRKIARSHLIIPIEHVQAVNMSD